MIPACSAPGRAPTWSRTDWLPESEPEARLEQGKEAEWDAGMGKGTPLCVRTCGKQRRHMRRLQPSSTPSLNARNANQQQQTGRPLTVDARFTQSSAAHRTGTVVPARTKHKLMHRHTQEGDVMSCIAGAPVAWSFLSVWSARLGSRTTHQPKTRTQAQKNSYYSLLAQPGAMHDSRTTGRACVPPVLGTAHAQNRGSS